MKRRPPQQEPGFTSMDPGAGGDLNVNPRAPRRQRSPDGGGAWFAWLLLILVSVSAGLANFWYIEPLRVQLRGTQEFLNEANTNVAQLQNQVGQLKERESRLLETADALQLTVQQREQDLQALQAAQEELARKLQEEVDQGDVLIHQGEGGLVVDLIDQVLFDSGEAALSAKGKKVLRNVGETLRRVPNKVLEVRGHTDAAPVLPPLTKRFPTNWELSTQRATNVVRFLMDDVGVPGERLVASGYAQYRPVADNKTESGRRRNRRIEVLLRAAAPKQGQ